MTQCDERLRGDMLLTKITDLKQNNIQKIRTCFYEGGVWTKNELFQETSISLAAITNILQSLLSSREIIYIGDATSTGGRKSKQYQINQDYYHILEVILKRNELFHELKTRSVDLLGNILYEDILQTSKGSVGELIDLIKGVIKKDMQIAMVCLSVPGVCQNGYIDTCDFDNLVEVNLKNILYQEFGLEIIVENDVNVACIGFSHQYTTYQHLAFIYQPRIKYVGCGLMIDRKLYNGYSHFAGELRYLPFYTHQQQEQLLDSNPLTLLEQQTETLCSVFNPEIIGIHSDKIQGTYQLSLKHIPRIHLPRIVYIDNFDDVIEIGLYQMGLNKLKERGGK